MSALAVLYGVKAVAGAGQAVYGMAQAQQARRQEALLRAQGLPTMQTPQEYFDLYQNASRSRAFEQEKAMTESIMASNLNVLASAGSRALIGAAPGVVTQAQRGIASAAERDFARQQNALQTLAAAQGQTEAYNFQQESAQYAKDLAGAQAGYQAGVETALAGASDAIGAAYMSYDNFGGDTKSVSGVDMTDAANAAKNIETPGTKSLPGVVTPQPGFDQGEEVKGLETGQDINGGFGVDPKAPSPQAEADVFSMFPTGTPPADAMPLINDGSYSTQQEAAANNPGAMIQRRADGRFIVANAKGGAITTPGKYTADHSVEYDVKTKGGKTIATVTGDETLVFNPSQRRFLKKVIGRLLKGQNVKLGKNETKTANQTLKAFKK